MAEEKKQSSDSECVKVAVRCRPMNSIEIDKSKHTYTLWPSLLVKSLSSGVTALHSHCLWTLICLVANYDIVLHCKDS